jgi:hypothetical protein
VRTLAREYHINESTIRERVRRHHWQRANKHDADELQRIARGGGLEGSVAKALLVRTSKPVPPRNPPQAPRSSEQIREAELKGAFEEAMGLIGDAVVEAKQRIVERAAATDLGNVDRLQALFDLHMGLLELAASSPALEDERGQRRKSEAMAYLLCSRGDSITGHLLAVTKLASEIQTITRKALGVADPPKQLNVNHQRQAPTKSTVSEERMQQLARMTTAQLSQIWHASRLLEGNTERPDIPMPPADPGRTAQKHNPD